ncbi:MAG: hypothetical protein IT370_15370 [Deltaproteobacteria bacterium]|nr:hypothetical protein [Deltaproteobacteria bacterium]
MRRATGLVVIVALAAAGLALGSCIEEAEEKSATAQFTVWCRVRDAAGAPVNGKFVSFSSAKYDYDGLIIEHSVFESGKTTTSLDPSHPGAVSFQVGYTLHQKGDEAETAEFVCSVPGPGGADIEAGFTANYEIVRLSALIEHELTLQLP